MRRGRLASASVGMLLVLTGCRKQEQPAQAPPPPTVLVTPVEQRDVPLMSEYVGALAGFIDAEIRARVPGFLQEQRYLEGTIVQKDQILFIIDPRQYEAQVAQAEGALARAQAGLGNARSTVRRLRPLAKQQAVSRQDLDNAVAAERQAVAQVDSARAAVEQAQLNLSYTQVRSPITGLAGRAHVRVGNLVGQGQPTLLTTVSQLDPMRVSFAIPEREYLEGVERTRHADGGISFQPPRMTVRLILSDGSVYPREGTLRIAGRGVNPQTGTLSLEAFFPNPDGLLRPGQSGRVQIITDTLHNALVIPQRAVRPVQGASMVGVVGPDDVVHIRTVKLGPAVGSNYVVEQGLRPGDRIVVEGLSRVQDGQKVSAHPAPPPRPAPAAAPPAGVGGGGPPDAGGGRR